MAGSSFDVLVLGAGPSGAAAAERLAAAGARVALIDGSHPREKPCGGGVTGRALSLVSDAVRAACVPHVRINTAAFIDPRSGSRAAVSLGNGLKEADGVPRLAVASRAAFDAALVDAARRSGTVFINDRARSIDRTLRGFGVTAASGRTFEASALIGADGANSLVRRRLMRPFRRDQLSIATGFFAHGCTSDEIVLEFTADPPGYIWSFPRPDHLAVGICTQADAGWSAADLRARTGRWIAERGLAPGAAALEPYAWPIPSLTADDFQTLPIAGPNWMLVGDAAGLVDPITREGIFFALQSAQCAADALASGGVAERVYTERVRSDIGAELARAARFKAGFFRPRFVRLLMEGLASSASIRQVVADLIAGTQPYRSLKWRLAKTLELGLAMKALKPE